MSSILSKCLSTATPSEEALIASAQAGDKAAIDKLTEIHYAPLLARVKNELCQRDDKQAGDILQEALCEVVSKLSDIDRKIPFAESVMQAARSLKADQDKQAYARCETINEFQGWEDSRLRRQYHHLDPADLISALEGVYEDLQRNAALESFLALMKASNSHKAGLCYLFTMCERGLTVDQIAAMEKRTPEQIKTALNNTCQYLRQFLMPPAPGQ